MPMIQIIIACHGRFAEELVQTADMVFGDTDGVHPVSFLPGEGPEDLIRKYKTITEAHHGDGVLYLVDLFGGSPYNAASRLVAESENADILTGVNLPMLLEILDSRDAHSNIASLVQAAYTAASEGIKAFHSPVSTTSSAQTEEPEFDYKKGRPTTGHMNIPLLRIDSRLIHGQVATSWAKAIKCDAIFAISDEVANDDLRSKLLLQVAPAHLQSYVISVDKAIKVWHNPMYADRNVMWLVTKPADIVRLIEGGVEIKSVNVGGMTFHEGDKMVSQAIAVGPDDVKAFHRLNEMGVELSIQQLAAHSPEPLMPKLANISF